MRTLKILVRKNLKMSPGKIAAQCVHAARGLLSTHWEDGGPVIVLEVSDRQFDAAKANIPGGQIVIDAGKTEVPPGTETAYGYWLDDETPSD